MREHLRWVVLAPVILLGLIFMGLVPLLNWAFFGLRGRMDRTLDWIAAHDKVMLLLVLGWAVLMSSPVWIQAAK